MGRSAALTALTALPSNSALDSACEKAGSPAKLADAIGVPRHVVVSWIGGAAIPADVCPSIEQATGSTCDDLRPDLLWVRDASGEVLAYTVPVDGADAAYVRQALASPPVACETTAQAEPRVDTLFDAERIIIEGQDGGDVSLTIDTGLRQAKVVLDVIEAAKVAATILAERERVMPTIPAGVHEELSEVPHALLPLRQHCDGGGVSMDVSIVDQQTTATVFRQRDSFAWYCMLKVGELELKLDRTEADALAYALTNGNDGSGLAHAAKLMCADMSEAAKVLRDGANTNLDAERVANKTILNIHTILDLHYQYEQHTYRRYGNLREGRVPCLHAVDRLRDAAKDAITTVATIRGALARDGYKDREGNDVTERGFYADLREAQRQLEHASSEVMVRVQGEAANVAWKNPLEATELAQDGTDGCFMTNIRWMPSETTNVGSCLDEASLTLRNATKLILNNQYDESEDTMSLLIGIAQASVDSAHSKLLRFASEGVSA